MGGATPHSEVAQDSISGVMELEEGTVGHVVGDSSVGVMGVEVVELEGMELLVAGLDVSGASGTVPQPIAQSAQMTSSVAALTSLRLLSTSTAFAIHHERHMMIMNNPLQPPISALTTPSALWEHGE